MEKAKIDNFKVLFWTLGITLFLIEFSFRSHVGAFGVRGPDTYWAFHWAQDYSHGFVRRGLLGEFMRSLGLDNSNYTVITFFSWLFSAIFTTLIIESLWNLQIHLPKADSILLLGAMIMNPVTAGLICETTGDPLQFILIIFIISIRLLNRSSESPNFIAVTFSILGIVASLIHEASVFFLLPAMLVNTFIVFRSQALRAATIGYSIGAMLAVVTVVLCTESGNGPSVFPAFHLGNQWIKATTETFPTFSNLLAQENGANFGHGFIGDLKTLKRLLTSCIYPTFLMVLLLAVSFGGNGANSKLRTKALIAYSLAFIMSLPLYVIAHDWGRFSGYTFIIAITSLSSWRSCTPAGTDPQRSGVLAFALFLAGLTTSDSALAAYRIDGLSMDNRLLVAFVAIAVVQALLFRRFWSFNLPLRTEATTG